MKLDACRVCLTGRLLYLMMMTIAAGSLLLGGQREAHAAPRNVLLLIADDFGVDVARFYPAPTRRETTPPAPPMPNLTALAQRGILFTRAWTAPWCSPTRAMVLTGRYGFRTGIGRANSGNLPPLPVSEVTLPEVIGEQTGNSYLMANIGKWHLSSGEDDPRIHGWPHYSGAHPDLGHLDSYYSWPKTVDGVTTTSTTYATTDNVDDTLDYIARAAQEGKPYFLWVGFVAPHDPFEKPPNELHGRDSLPATGAPKRSLYEAMVESLDTEIGRLLRAVDLSTTTVIFVGDNGTTGPVTAPPYVKTQGKGTMYQGGVHVPLFIAGAGVVGPGRKVSALVNTVDLFPTILELVGIDPAQALGPAIKTDGVSLLPYLERRTHPNRRQWVFAEQFTKTFDTSWQRALRSDRYVLIERFDGSREFYDMEKDFFQASNLLAGIMTSTERGKLSDLKSKLDALLATR